MHHTLILMHVGGLKLLDRRSDAVHQIASPNIHIRSSCIAAAREKALLLSFPEGICFHAEKQTYRYESSDDESIGNLALIRYISDNSAF